MRIFVSLEPPSKATEPVSLVRRLGIPVGKPLRPRAALAISSRASITLPLLFLSISLGSFAEPLWHVMAKGETIYGIAREYGISPEALESVNGISDPGKIKIGQRLLVPRTHRVEKGDTLYGIAREAGTSVAELSKLNHLAPGALLKTGDVLVLPAEASSANVKAANAAAGSHDSAPAAAPAPPGPTATATATATAVVTVTGVPPAAAGTKVTPTATAGASGGTAALAGRKVSSKASLPCAGEARYLDGKLFGIAIKAAEGSPVKAVASGTVVSAGPYRGFGSVAFVQGRNGLIYVYGGTGAIEVEVGDTVKPGLVIGKVARDPLGDSAEAYFFVFKGSVALDPALAPRD